MSRDWISNLRGKPDPPERPDNGDDSELPAEPTHQQYKVDGQGKRTTSVSCYCDATDDHPA
jgi:hypothetical protein